MQRTTIGTNPINQTRLMAATQLAVFEAANAITGEYVSYLEPAIVAPAGASLDAAIVSAAHRMLTVYFPGAGAVAALNAARDLDLGSIPSGPSKDDGIAVGVAAANAMLARRAGDVPPPVPGVMTGARRAWRVSAHDRLSEFRVLPVAGREAVRDSGRHSLSSAATPGTY